MLTWLSNWREDWSMPTIERRIALLEQTTAGGPLLIFVDEPPTLEQRRSIEDAERAGRTVILVSWLDAAL